MITMASSHVVTFVFDYHQASDLNQWSITMTMISEQCKDQGDNYDDWCDDCHDYPAHSAAGICFWLSSRNRIKEQWPLITINQIKEKFGVKYKIYDWSGEACQDDCSAYSAAPIWATTTTTSPLGQRVTDSFNPNAAHISTKMTTSFKVFEGKLRFLQLQFGKFLPCPPPQVSEGRRWWAAIFLLLPPNQAGAKTLLSIQRRAIVFASFSFRICAWRIAAFKIGGLGERTRWPGPGATRAPSSIQLLRL